MYLNDLDRFKYSIVSLCIFHHYFGVIYNNTRYDICNIIYSSAVCVTDNGNVNNMLIYIKKF